MGSRHMLKASPGRFFVDIAAGGCPCGCRYCYVPVERERPLGESSLSAVADTLAAHPDFMPGPRGSLITLGVHCDCFRTQQLTAALIYMVGRLAPHGNPIQVATKQSVSERAAAELSQQLLHVRQLVVFISCVSMSSAALYEPRCTDPEVRLRSLLALRHARIPSCLYIKPFLPGVTDADADLFVAAMRAHAPDAVCVGTLYLSSRIAGRLELPQDDTVPSGTLTHPLMAGCETAVEPPPQFVRHIQSSAPETRVFLNSACVVAHLQGIPCPTRVADRFPSLCVGCPSCPAAAPCSPRPARSELSVPSFGQPMDVGQPRLGAEPVP